jgi:hypothetical protein
MIAKNKPEMVWESRMLRAVRSVVLGASLLALGACQTTGVSPDAISKIQAAGYQPVTHSTLATTSSAGWTTYACPAEKCGRLSVLGFNTTQGSSNIFGETMEAQLRKPGLTRAKVQSEFSRGLITTYPSGKVTSARIFQTATNAGILYAATGKTSQGVVVHFSGRVAIRGNTAAFIIGAGETTAVARKAMNLALEVE